MTTKLAAALALCALGVWLSAATATPVGLFCVPVAALVVFDLLGAPPRPKLRFERHVAPQRVVVGDEVLVELFVTNLGGRLGRLEVWDQPPLKCEVVKGSTRLFCTLGEGEQTVLRYTLRCPRVGSHVFGIVRFKASTLFGFSETSGLVQLGDELRVYPRLLHRRLSASWAKTLSNVGLSPSKRGGGRSEYLEIRQYVRGDPLDSVNWKAYARTGRPHVNVWSSERGLDCILVVDLYSSDVQRLGSWSSRDQIVCCAYELASTLLGGGNRVGLVVLGSLLLKLQPAYGPRQLRRIVEALLDVEEGSSWAAGNVGWVLQLFFAQQYRERRGVLFFITSYPSTAVLDAMRDLSAKGFRTHLVFVNTVEEELQEISRLKLVKQRFLRVGETVARTEISWFEKQASEFSGVAEWSAQSGFRVIHE